MSNWDDSDDDDAWDVDSDDDELDARLSKLNTSADTSQKVPEFNDEEDLAVKEKERLEKLKSVELKKKGNAMHDKKKAEAERKEEEELARKAMELEAEHELNMTEDEKRQLERKRAEAADDELVDDLFGGGEPKKVVAASSSGDRTMQAGDNVDMKDLKDHLKHARKIGQCINKHNKVHLASAFLKEVIQDCKNGIDDDAIANIIKICNVIKNEKVAASKKKVKGQAQKSKKNKAAEDKAKKIQKELYGDNDEYDEYDDYGDTYEDDFF